MLGVKGQSAASAELGQGIGGETGKLGLRPSEDCAPACFGSNLFEQEAGESVLLGIWQLVGLANGTLKKLGHARSVSATHAQNKKSEPPLTSV